MSRHLFTLNVLKGLLATEIHLTGPRFASHKETL